MDTVTKIKEYIAQKGYRCKENLVESYCLSLQTKPFAFLMGNSDTDMTLLPRLVAESVGAREDNGRYLQLSVRPDWMDSSDLFGWLNLEGKFIPGVIMDFLKKAHEDPENPYFLCLDKLILSRAEYYLRDIFNAMDTKGQENPLPYVPVIYFGRDEAAIAKYGQIPMLHNLYMVATVNLDETSIPLNQKLLDRANTLHLTPESVTGEGQGVAEPVAVPENFLQTRYYTLDQCRESLEDYFAIFEEINAILMAATSYVGFKIRNDGILLLLHNQEEKLLPQQAAMDHVICQKVLPRVQGSKKLLQPVLEKLYGYLAKNGYTQSAEKAQKMLLQCAEGDYISYWV